MPPEARAWEEKVARGREAAVAGHSGVHSLIAMTAAAEAARAAPRPPPPHRHTGGVQPASAIGPPQGGTIAAWRAGGNSRHCRVIG